MARVHRLSFSLPATGGHGTFQTVTAATPLEVSAGTHVLRTTAGLWSQGYVEVYSSTFFGNTGSELVLENNATPAARVKITDSIVSDAGTCGAAASKEGGTTLEFVNSRVCDGAAGTPVVLRAPSSSWTGAPADAFTPVDAAITQGYRPAP